MNAVASLDQYEVIGVIGKGSFGTVSRIRRKSDSRILVWKEMNYGTMREKEKQLIVSEVCGTSSPYKGACLPCPFPCSTAADYSLVVDAVITATPLGLSPHTNDAPCSFNSSSSFYSSYTTQVNILRELRHPFIVRYYDRIIDKAASKIYIVMEFCDGGDLSDIIRRCKKDK